MKTITPCEMKALETQWMQENGVPGILLMENAAHGVVKALRNHVSSAARVLFLCGPGNNGGDGYAAARLWKSGGGESVLLSVRESSSGDAAVNRRLCAIEGIRDLLWSAEDKLPECDAVVDALFGTGLSRAPEGAEAALIHAVNQLEVPIVSVDIPSGLNGETGEAAGPVLHASETVTFHRIKQGLLLRDGPDCTGAVTRHPILIPQDFGTAEGFDYLTEADLSSLIHPRRPTGHKGTFGRVLICAGSPGMAGAAAMAARAALKAGAGLVALLCRESILPILQVLVPQAVAIALPEDNGRLTAAASQILEQQLSVSDSAVFGCGIGRGEDLKALLPVLTEAKCPVVWDADALNLLSEVPHKLPRSAVMTPHPGEAARLLHCEAGAVTSDAPGALDRLASAYGCHVLLKGARTLMTDGTRKAVNLFGTPALGKGGSGDILSGILAALLAQKKENLNPDQLIRIQAASAIHGLAGLRAEKQSGSHGVTVEELIGCIRTGA